MTIDQPNVPFSQRNGLEPTPPQWNVGELPPELRRQLDYYICREISRATGHGYERAYFLKPWQRVTMDLHVLHFKLRVKSYDDSPSHWLRRLSNSIADEEIGEVFDIIEFLVQHSNCSDELKSDLSGAFVSARAAYRIVDSQIVAIGTEEQAIAFENAIEVSNDAIRNHLITAGVNLRNSNWAASIRESIHAVEAAARQIVPGARTLAPALDAIEKQGRMHGALKSGFSSLYGFTNDEEGIRHALVTNPEAQVDEIDALFMLGACASFVSYLNARRELPTSAD